MEDTTYPITVPGSEILGQLVRPEREYTVKLYDFKRPDKFSLEQINTVRVLHEALARQCAPVLGRIAGTAVNVRCSSVDQMTYAEFLGSIPAISALVPVTMSPLKGPMLIQLDGSLAVYLVRVACGGEALRAFEDPDRTLTELERVVFRDLAEQLVPAIDESWRNVIELGCAVTEIETDQQMVQLVPPTEMIILVSLEVRVGESAAFINFAIPYLTIEPIVGRLSMQWWFGKVRHGASTVAGRAADFPVGVDLFAQADAIPLARLTSIASGDLLELPALADGTAQIAAGGVTVIGACTGNSLHSSAGESPGQ